MAIDSRGQITTTGILNKPNTNVQAPNMSNLTQTQVKQSAQVPQVKQSAQVPQPVARKVPQPIAREIPQRSVENLNKDNTVERLQTLTAEDMTVLVPVLSPSVKSVLAKIIPEITPLLEGIGTNEETVPVKVSTFASLPGDIQDFIIQSTTEDQMDTNNVPLDTPSDTSGMMARQEPKIPQTSEEGMSYNQIDEGLIS